MKQPQANAEQISHWNESAGPVWVAYQDRLDRQIRGHGERAIGAASLAPGDAVLDIGCGCGETSLEIARRVGSSGGVHGIDVSAPMLARARERAREAGFSHLDFSQMDAQSADLGEGVFDVAFSRFGVMFFDNPRAAFANISRALKSDGRLAFVCWQAPQENPWIALPMAAIAPHVTLPPPPAVDAPGMFSLADPERIQRLLAEAGFADISVEGAEIPMAPGGGGLDQAVDLFLEVGPARVLLEQAGGGEALHDKLVAAVREAYAPFATEQGMRVRSAAWIVTAQNARAARPAFR